ncbi:MAG: Uma2 family endonuclease [Limisphaerales bacterium]
MPSLVIELPARPDQTAFNLKRWAELLDDAELARIEGRIETDRHGQVIMSPPPSANHARYGYKIARLIEQFLPGGESLTECPISTADGVKSADAVWASKESIRNLGNRVCFPRAPEICVEVLSPRNTKAEIEEKKSLYFNAGAKEVWVCSRTGVLSFFQPGSAAPIRGSKLCPQFPNKIVLAT